MASKNSIEKLVAEYQSIQMAKKYLRQLELRIQQEQKRLEKMEERLKKDQSSYKTLQKSSFKGLFFKLLGTKEEQYQTEKKQYLRTTLKYNECLKSIDLLSFERKILLEKISSERAINKRLAKNVADRTELIHKMYPAISKILLSINEKIDFQTALLRELEEADDLSTFIEKELQELLSQLKKVLDDDVWLNSVGSGIPDDYWINEMLGEAIDRAFRLKQLFLKLSEELKDLHPFQNALYHKTYQDIIFFNINFQDELISDWVLEQKLRSAIGSLEPILKEVQKLLSSLEQQLASTKNNVRTKENKIREVISKHLGN